MEDRICGILLSYDEPTDAICVPYVFEVIS